MNLKRLLCAGFLMSVLAACASTPPALDTQGVMRSPSPQVFSSGDTEAGGETPLLWGGVIVSTANLSDYTQLEVLSYPLKGLRPDTTKTPTGRFLIRHQGYLETIDYASGREVSAVGLVTEMQEQKVGEASYQFPVLADQQLHLWPVAKPQQEPRLNFGFGVVLSN